jgi:hypothetical protein
MTTEQELSDRLGVSRAILKKMRGELLADDWSADGRSIRYTEEGVAAIVGLLEKNAGGEPTLTATVSDALAGGPGALVRLTASRKPVNPKILLCHVGEKNAGPEVRCRVRSTVNFFRGMVFSAKHVEGTLYELVGRCPRFPGRW